MAKSSPGTAKVNIEFDGRKATGEVAKFTQSLQRLGAISKETRAGIDTLAHSTQALTGAFAAVSASARKMAELGGFIIKANSDFENLKSSLTGLISVSHSNIDTMGRLLNIQQKWILSTKKADETLQSLNKIASKTSFSLEQTSQMFKAFYSTAASNLSLEQSIEAFEGLANMASVVGINVEQMIRTLDGVGAGKWTSSELTRFLEGNLGLTKELAQEAIKSGKYYELLMGKLSEFSKMSQFTSGSYEASVASLKNEFNQLAQVLGQPIFESLKEGLKDTAKFLNENRDGIVKFVDVTQEVIKVLGVLGASYVTVNLSQKVFDKMNKAIASSTLLSNTALTRKTQALGLLSVGLDRAKIAAMGLGAAFKSFLPTAALFVGFELLIKLLGSSEEKMTKLGEAATKTAEEIRKLTVAQQRLELQNTTKHYHDTTKEINETIKKLDLLYERSKKAPIRPDGTNPFREKYKKEITILEANLENLVKEQARLSSNMSDITQALYENANASIGGLSQRAKEIENIYEGLEKNLSNIITPTKLKEQLAELDAYIAQGSGKMLEAAKIERERIAKQLGDMNKKGIKDATDYNNAIKQISQIGLSEYEKKLADIVELERKWIDAGVPKAKAKEAAERLKDLLDTQTANDALKEYANFLKEKETLLQEYYLTIGEYEKAWAIESKKLKEKFAPLGLTEEEAKKYLEIQKKKFFEPLAKVAKNSFKDIKGSWADTVSTMQKTVEEGFFDFFMQKTKSLKSALKDIGQNLFRDFMSPYARSLSQGIGGLFGSFLGGGSNLASLASFYGLSKSDTGSFVGEVAGTAVEIASNGEIIKGGSAFGGASNILSMASNLKSAYTMLTSGYSGLVSNFTTAPAGYLSSYLSSAGYTGASFGIQGLGVGAQHALTGNLITGGGLNGTLSGAYGAGYIGGATLAGGALGYGVGTLGDKLFKANSYASSVGAVGGALGGMASTGAFGAKIGSMVGPWGAVIGAVAGALIGGMFGKKKAIGTGISVNQDFTTSTQLNSEIIRGYVQMQKKGWFSKKEWKDYHDLGADILGDISSQVKQMEKLALRAGAITGLTIKKGAYSGNSFSDTAITKAIISAMTGLDQEIWVEQISTTKKRKGFLGKLTNVYDKIMKYSPSTLANKATRPLDNALGRIMNKNGLGALHDQSIAGRVEIGDISDGKILDFEPTKKLEEKLGIIQEIQTKNMRQIVNPEIERMFQDWQEIAKKEKKNINEVITASLVSITDTYKALALISQKNPLKQAQINIELMFEEFKDAAEGLKVEIPKNLSSIAELSAEEMASAYRKAIANDFTKENIDGLNSLVKVYQEARKAQDDFTKSIISFTGQIANTQGGFYQAHGINTSFLAQQATYTKFRTLLSSLSGEISKEEKDSISKFGEFGNIQTWSKYLLGMSSKDMQGFLSAGNTELRNDLIATITEYQRQIQANGGKEFWLKSFTDIENIDKQIAALKLAKQTEETLKIQQEKAQKEMQMQKEQLSILNLQRAAVEKIGNIAQRIRNQVIDRTTSPINYANALKAAKEAYAKGDYKSKAFDNLSDAADHQRQYFEDTLESYEEYRFSMLSMASEIEAISNKTTLADINAAIESLERELEKTKKTLDEEMKKANSLAENQIAALEQQRMQLVQNSQNEIKALEGLLGTNAPMVKYFKDILEAVLNKDMPKDAEKIKVPNYTGGVENINTPATTANNALLVSGLDYDINKLYMSVLGRSVDQAGLDFWKSKIESKELNISNLAGELIKAAIALTGSSQKEDWIAWHKARGYKPFADGGIVTRPTRALIGEAGYNEAIIPLKDGRGVKVDMDGGFELLSNTMNKLEQISQKIEKNTKELVLFLRGVISEDGEKIQAKVLA